jgi:Protein of unknown function (DUF3800)
MNFEVYCDEAHPDLLTSKKSTAQYLLIGSLWLPADFRESIKERVKELRQKHNVWGEIKWSKVSPSKLEFYLELLDVFFSHGLDLRFRCIVVEASKINMALHDNDHELGFYKFYYQLLKHWILEHNSYRFILDVKTNRDPKRHATLKKVLVNSNIFAEVKDLQALPSSQVVLIQLTDFLLGAASARLNQTIKEGSVSEVVLKRLESHLNMHQLQPTAKSEHKFNIFKIRLEGGW